jgi:glycosyltransferase involved in cell wall biosynthesis
MVKVCMVVHQYYYRDARVKRYAEALADSGVQIDVLNLRDPNQPANIDLQGVRAIPIPIGRSATSKIGYIIEYFLAMVFFATWLTVLHIKNRYDIIHVHNMPDFLIFTALIPRLLGAKLILDIHDPMPEFYMSKYQTQQNDSIVVRMMRLQEKVSAGLAHAVIAANPNFARNIAKRGVPAEKITVVNNVADSRLFDRAKHRSEKQNEYFTLIYPGTVAPRYGLDVAIRAMPLLAKEIPNVRFVIIGMGTHAIAELKVLAEQIGVTSCVEFRPLVPVGQVPAQIAQADVGIYPALSDPHMDIAMPTKVIEFAFMGIPVVASRLPVLVDTFGDESILFFDPGNEEQLANHVLQLFHDVTLREQLVQNMDRTFIPHHSWDNERRAYFALLSRMLGKPLVQNAV